jgi:hypothetical protein
MIRPSNTHVQSPYAEPPQVELVLVPTDDFENRIVRLLAQLLVIDEFLARDEASKFEGKAA